MLDYLHWRQKDGIGKKLKDHLIRIYQVKEAEEKILSVAQCYCLNETTTTKQELCGTQPHHRYQAPNASLPPPPPIL